MKKKFTTVGKVSACTLALILYYMDIIVQTLYSLTLAGHSIRQCMIKILEKCDERLKTRHEGIYFVTKGVSLSSIASLNKYIPDYIFYILKISIIDN